MTNLEIDNAYVGASQVDKMYLGSELIWGGSEPEPVYSAMPLTFKVLSAGTIVFGRHDSTSYTADTCSFKYNLNSVSGTFMTDSTTPLSLNVQAGDIFEISGQPNFGFQNLGKGNGTTTLNTAYHSFSGTTAKVEVYGNIMSMCMYLEEMSGFTTWQAAVDWGMLTPNSDYVVTSLFRNVPGLVSAENLWLPLDAPKFAYLSFMKNNPNLVKAPKELPAETLQTYCYSDMFDADSALTESPIIRATGYTSTQGFALNMFRSCSNLNKITCFLDQTSMTSSERSSAFSNWVNGVAATGNFYKRNGAGWYSGTSGYPTNWTMNIYQE